MNLLFSSMDSDELEKDRGESDGEWFHGPINGLVQRRYIDSKEVFPFWAVWKVLRERLMTPYICSPSGIIMRAGSEFFYGTYVYDFDDFTLPVEDDTDLADFLDDYSKKEKSGDYFPVEDAWAISLDGWMIRDKEGIISAIKENIDPLEAELEGNVEAFPDEYNELVNNLSRFSGWSLCFKDTDVPPDDEKMLSLVGLNVNARVDAKSELEPTDIVQEIIRMVDAGLPVVRGAVRRNLAPKMKEELWRSTWAEASKARPIISRRGPKTGNRNSRG